ncbi:hypothetical protein Y1Q_0015735 [Alligator mississippiensis]|uniref:Uncharacterized protein n=1 Tax=Alligator mississippiensis TaxID=8496 RepID=A0A151M5J8_ALLMI|nr:hypothetical protein Y1Q_0015735 [Alligator mississippiensis]
MKKSRPLAVFSETVSTEAGNTQSVAGSGPCVGKELRADEVPFLVYHEGELVLSLSAEETPESKTQNKSLTSDQLQLTRQTWRKPRGSDSQHLTSLPVPL